MIGSRKLAAVFTAAVMVTSLSAFAESRHREATNQRDGSSWRDQRNDDRNYDRHDRRGSGGYNQERYEGRRSYSSRGRVTRLERYRGGYRVWLGGGYPFFVPEATFRHFPLRVGISVVLGGYWNPAGYYDVYDYNGYNTSGDLRGVIESVDYRRGTLVLHDDISRSFVTTVFRGRDRRFRDLRPGDYVELTGEWQRNGVFNAYDVTDVRDGRYDRYNRY